VERKTSRKKGIAMQTQLEIYPTFQLSAIWPPQKTKLHDPCFDVNHKFINHYGSNLKIFSSAFQPMLAIVVFICENVNWRLSIQTRRCLILTEADNRKSLKETINIYH
jgi:hypothetical protein